MFCLAPGMAWGADAPPPTSPTSSSAGSPPSGSSSSTSTSGEDEESKQAQQGPQTLEQRIRPVSGTLFPEAGRHELAPEIGLSLADPFFQKLAFGVKYAYHFTNSFSLGLHFDYALSFPSNGVNICDTTGCHAPTSADLVKTPGNLSMIIGVDAAWAPLYGKVNVLAEKVIHLDGFVVGGLDGIQYADPSNGGSSTFTFGGHVGVGTHIFFNDFFCLRLDLREYLYAGHRDQNGAAEGRLENQMMFELGFDFFLPLHPNPDA
jgi:outer membrane beta-barrel protein